jgi:hypothetical protein
LISFGTPISIGWALLGTGERYEQDQLLQELLYIKKPHQHFGRDFHACQKIDMKKRKARFELWALGLVSAAC